MAAAKQTEGFYVLAVGSLYCFCRRRFFCSLKLLDFRKEKKKKGALFWVDEAG